MIVIGIADLHGDATRVSQMEEELRRCDVVLVAGDVTNFGDADKARKVLEPLRELTKHVLAVSGNCDYPDVDPFLDTEGIGLHGKGIVVGGVGFSGAGASLACPGRTPNEVAEEELMDVVGRGRSSLDPSLPWILLTHQPAFLTKNDVVSGGVHVGSKELRRFISKERPLLHLTGHIHEAVGIDEIQDTTTVNPGPFRSGRYVWVELEGGALKSVEIRKAGSR
ncbi:MAG: metallophosphoesterase family protein [Planctomycetota bacterium]|jgi:Icc-related predicted phosphoesterase